MDQDTSKTKKIVISALGATLLIVGVFFFYIFYIIPNKPGFTKNKDGKLVLDFSLRRDNISHSIEGQNEYVEKLDNILEKNDAIPDYPKALITITKASRAPAQTLASWSSERGGIFSNSYNDTHSIFTTLGNYEEKYRKDLYTRIIIEVQNFFESSCFNVAWFNDSAWGKEPAYLSFKDKYKTSKEWLPVFAYLETIYDSPNVVKDKTTISTHMLILARILDNFATELNEDDKNRYVAKLQTLSKEFPTAEENKLYAKTYTGKSGTYHRDYIYYYYSLGILSNIDSTLDKQKITNEYRAILTDFKAESTKENYMFNALYLDYMSFVLMGYLFENNGGVVTDEIKTLISETIERNKSLAKEAVAIENFYFINMTTPMGEWDNVRGRLFMIAKKDATFKKFLQEKGVIF